MMPAERRFRRVLQQLLALYPGEFYRQFGQDIVEAHVDRYRRQLARGRGRSLSAAASAVADLCWGAVLEWWAIGKARYLSEGVIASVPMQSASELPRQPEGLSMSALLQTFTFAARSLSRRWRFVGAIVLTLSLGIGANTAVFSLVDAVLLHPLPVAHPESLVAIYDASNPAAPRDGVPYPTYRDLEGGNRTLLGLAAYRDNDVALHALGASEQVSVCLASGNYFTLLGLRPQKGRLLVPSDEGPPLTSPVAVISDELWERLFRRNPDVVGTAIGLGPTLFTVVGVAPRGFRGTTLTSAPALWVPVTMIQSLDLGGIFNGRFSQGLLTTFRGYGWLHLVGRVRPGASFADAQSDLTDILARVRIPRPSAVPSGASAGARIEAVPITAAAAFDDRQSVIRFVEILLGVVALILVLACINVANLLLARGSERARELGVSAALGASRSRLFALLVCESALLAAGGAVGGVGLGAALMRLLAAFSLPGQINIDRLDLSLNARVLSCTLGLSVATTVVFGLLPAWRGSRLSLADAFRSQARGMTGSGPRAVLLTLQVGATLVIAVAAALFIRSLRAGLQTDLGFDAHGTAVATVELRLQGYSLDRAALFYRSAVDRIAGTPGITGAAAASHVPLAPNLMSEFPFRAVGAAAGPPGSDIQPLAGLSYVTPGYFAALGVPFLAGRDFAPSDGPKSPPVVIVNAAAAHALWPGESAVGKQVQDFADRPFSVIGVVRDTKYESLGDVGKPYVFFSVLQEPVNGKMTFIARSDEAPRALVALRHAIASADSRLPMMNARRLQDQVDAILMPQRFGATLLSAFSFIALGIATFGIYATLVYTLTQRRMEIGIRIALGARGADVLRVVLLRTGTAVGAGMLVGLGAAALTARAAKHFLFGVSTIDAPAFAAATAVVAAAVVLVGLAPARRAMRIDPVVAMRQE
jgi:macrolide transport system ATP-binding/permease protein